MNQACDPSASTGDSTGAATGVAVTLGPGWGWSRHQVGAATLVVRGYLFSSERTLVDASATRHAAKILEPGAGRG
jgi:hypothetical protein